MLLIVAALVWLALLPVPRKPFTHRTYVDENALQPGYAEARWGAPNVHEADRISAQLHEIARQDDKDARIAYLVQELRSYDLDVHTQTYAFYVPGQPEPIQGTNVYARSYTPRTDGRVAMILAANWQSHWRQKPSDSSELPYVPDDGTYRAINVRGIALLLAYAKHAASIPHWSKDYLFVISDGFLDGMQAWAAQYFGTGQPNLEAEAVHTTGAQVWNALALDYPADSFSSFNFYYEGRDGLLPNLDTINTVTDITQLTYMSPSLGLHGESADEMELGRFHVDALRSWLPVDWLERHWLGRHGVKSFVSGWVSILRQLRYQLAGRPSGIHGVLLPFHVDAITLFARPAPGPFGFQQLGDITELTFRSFSNLIERLHHSQFFYLLPSPWYFVQIGVFILVPLLLGAALTFTGLSVWVQLGARRQKQCEALRRPYTKGRAVLATPTYAEFAQLCTDESLRALFRAHSRPVLPALLCMGVAHIVCAACWALWTQTPAGPQALVGTGMLCIAATITMVYVASRFASSRHALGMCLHAFALLHAGMVVSVLAPLNFAQATAMAMLLCLTLYSVPTAPSRCRAVAHALCLMVVSPPSLVALLHEVCPRLLTHTPAFVPHIAPVIDRLLWDYHVLRTSALPILCLVYAPIVLEGCAACLLYSAQDCST